jgi:branched-chain amino acid transport system ATP-binding protein
MPILEGKGVTKYFGGLAAVSNVDCNVEQGKTLSHKGAGKTTLFHGISAVLVPRSGEIRFKGQNSTGLSPYTI